MTPVDKLAALEAEMRDHVRRNGDFSKGGITESWADRLAALRAEKGEAVPVGYIWPGTAPPASVPVEALGLLDALRWYVEHDDTNEGQPGNEYYIAGRDRARAAIEAFVAAQEKP